MKIFYYVLALLLIVAVENSQAQLATDSWALGFGGRYPRYVDVNIKSLHSNYGGYLSLQRNFSEHVGLRLKGGYSHLEGEWTNAAFTTILQSTDLITADLDLMYYLVPCEPVSPYLYAGAGATYRMLTNKATASLDDNAFGAQWNAGGGVEWRLGADWKFVTEFGYHATSNSQLDGMVVPTENNGSDKYWGVSVGFLYLFAKGEPSPLCMLPSGITQMSDMTDYNRIEDMIKRHIPKEVVKEIVVEKQMKAESEKWILIGVNFDLDKSNLLPESYPILYNAAQTLLKNPDMKVEIEGHTCNIGSDNYNMKLGQERADVVKNYLVSKGVAASRLSTVSYGESRPAVDNNTEYNRAMNRRIAFKIQ